MVQYTSTSNMWHAMMEGSEVWTPYYEVRKAALEPEKERIKRNLQPASFYSPRLSCTMLLISNLATPEWISIDCDEPLLDNIICVNDTFDSDLTSTTSIFLCPDDAIIHGKSCFKFKWFGNNNKHDELCQKDNMKMLSTKVDFKTEFKYLFEASSAIFPAVLEFDFSSTLFTYIVMRNSTIISCGVIQKKIMNMQKELLFVKVNQKLSLKCTHS